MRFEEKQRFTQWWIWLLIVGVTLIPAYGIYKQVYLGEHYGNNPISDLGMTLFLIFMLAFIVFFRIMELRTHIDEEFIRVHFFPFTKKKIAWKDVASAKIVDYGFVGGWGIRLGTKYGTIYNTSGKMGLALRLKNGSKLCIGTQQVEALERVVKENANL